jgi:hypothetical protein
VNVKKSISAMNLVERSIVGRVSNKDLATVPVETLRGLASIARGNLGLQSRVARSLLERWMQLKPLKAQDLMSRGGLMPGDSPDTMYFNPVVIKGTASTSSPKKALIPALLALVVAGAGIYFLTRG